MMVAILKTKMYLKLKGRQGYSIRNEVLKLQTNLMTVPSSISDTNFQDFIKYQLLELQTNSMMVHC